MTSLKALALAGIAVAGLSLYASTDAEARGFRGGGGGFRSGGVHLGGARHFGGVRHIGGPRLGFHGPRHGHRHGFWRHGVWVGGLGIATVGASCYRYRWIDTPYGLERRLVNVCVY
ncbi:hypothetical protein [Phreatobacter oligotrophus]|jgi:hypothetical protein|uniref:Sulfur globule protein n=1 Tax=Phreatobacter oligotrophus TaxID=1122261 RepID=A0A2T4ZIB0_9HYPH|nr:hypothetical protein [Phreatobacter oligotrophus]MBX9992226.1 hypothetical protein [Phreatobacter oligotrophus]PTM61712.1 hypothetical protein C8P69_101383 [Phreatobacter oligotrophus]